MGLFKSTPKKIIYQAVGVHLTPGQYGHYDHTVLSEHNDEQSAWDSIRRLYAADALAPVTDSEGVLEELYPVRNFLSFEVVTDDVDTDYALYTPPS